MADLANDLTKTKIFILDTSVLMHDPDGALNAFQEHTVINPIIVTEELDHLKTHDSKGMSAREVIRQLAELIEGKDLVKGVPTKSGGLLKIDTDGDNPEDLPMGFDPNKPDNIILLTAKRIQNDSKGQIVVLVSKDLNLRLKAQANGINAEDYLHGRIADKAPHSSSIAELFVGKESIAKIHQTGSNRRLSASETGIDGSVISALVNNACVRLIGRDNPKKTVNAIFDKRAAIFEMVDKIMSPDSKKKPGIAPRNEGQAFALALASSPNAQLITLGGNAGTGKSLMALLAGWRRVISPVREFENTVIDRGQQIQKLQKIIVYRPTRELGKELGFLPGTLDEKFAPWQRPTLSNLHLIATAEGRDPDFLQELFAKQTIEILPINHIRGDTINNAYILLDDAQNLTPHEMKSVVTRVGENTTLVITGDASQVDVPFLDAYSNGFTHVVAKFAGQMIYAHFELTKGERSELAEIAARIL